MNQEEIDNLNRPVTRGDVESVIKKKKKFRINKSLEPDGFTGKLYQTYVEELTLILLKLFQKIREERALRALYEATITPIPKPDTDNTKKKITAQFFDENRCKNSQQNISKPNLTHKQDHTPQPCWIHVKFTSVLQHMQINQCDILHKQNNRQSM